MSYNSDFPFFSRSKIINYNQSKPVTIWLFNRLILCKAFIKAKNFKVFLSFKSSCSD